ncbi:hypothetical protein OG792_17015 [Micromonospora sp. NBC_01699]|uniref:hypothetical protein n=1 Tax=Micromonospora sp. NBC_01699 TaxID=2975984 RepID=UPI002E2FE18C|nr:hypothetical protein [Micromonospora sp. NBC_01699]
MRLTRIVASAMAAFVMAGALATMTSSPAAAQPQPSYPPQPPVLTLSDATLVVGDDTTLFGRFYGPTEIVDITFTLLSVAAGAPERASVRQDTGATIAMVPVAYPAFPPLTATTNAQGEFQLTFSADWRGVWQIRGVGRESGVDATTQMTVVHRQLPVTGSSLGRQLGIGAGLLLLGVVLVMLTVVRRRRGGVRAGTA